MFWKEISITVAKALGVPIMTRITNAGSLDLNTYFNNLSNGLYFHYFTGFSDIEDSHAPEDYLMVFTFKYASSDVWQLASGIVARKMYYREKSSSAWGAWKQIATA